MVLDYVCGGELFYHIKYNIDNEKALNIERVRFYTAQCVVILE